MTNRCGAANKAVVAVVAIVVIVAAGYLILRQVGDGAAPNTVDDKLALYGPPEPVYYVCDECGAESTGYLRGTPFACAKCQKKAVVESVRYRCGACGKQVEVWRKRLAADQSGYEFKLPGAAWQAMEQAPQPKCPGCGNHDAASLRRLFPPAPPAEGAKPTP